MYNLKLLKFFPQNFIILLFLVSSNFSFSQCPTGYLQLTTQQEVDDFVSNYPNCINLNSGLSIGTSNANGISDISDLSGLINIETINGELSIQNCPSLSSLTGLESIENIRFYLGIANLDGITDLSELSSLTTDPWFGSPFGQFQMYIGENDNLTSLVGLENITILNYTTIRNNPSLTGVDGLSGLVTVSELEMENNASLESLDGLQSLTEIRTGLSMYLHPSLTDVSILDNIDPEELNYLYIEESPNLTFCNSTTICSFIATSNDFYFGGNGTWCDIGTITTACDPCIYIGAPGQFDDDCDGIENDCDVCPGGDDTVDFNENDIPDCKESLSYNDYDPSWHCANNKILVSHNGNQICVNKNAINGQLNSGAFIGPVASCTSTSNLIANNPNNTGAFINLKNKVGQSNIEIYPNPVTDVLTISISNRNSFSTILIYNTLGSLVWESIIPAGESTKIVDVSSQLFETGIYHIQVLSNDDSFSRKILVNK